jgi:dTMP kinase
MNRGVFITFEGGEGAGKSTQIRLLATHLVACGRRATTTREPGGTPLAEAIRALLLGKDGTSDPVTQALLFAAARRDHIHALIAPALAEGQVVLCDRFTDSTRAYQGGRLPAEALEATLKLGAGDLAPDLTFLLDLPPEIGLARVRRRGATGDTFEQAELAFHEAVRARFLALAEAEPARIARIDASQTEEMVAEAIRRVVDARLLAGVGGAA